MNEHPTDLEKEDVNLGTDGQPSAPHATDLEDERTDTPTESPADIPDASDLRSELDTGVPLQETEDHLGRLIGRQPVDTEDSTQLTFQQERDLLIDEDDEALLAEQEVENAEDDVIDADADDALRSNNLTPRQLADSTSREDLLTSETERRDREGHVISWEDRG